MLVWADLFVVCARLGNENSAQSFSDRSFWKSLRVVDVRTFGSWISAPECLFSRILSALTEVLGREIRANDPRMSAEYPARKLPLWADFSFLKDEQNFCGEYFPLKPCVEVAVKANEILLFLFPQEYAKKKAQKHRLFALVRFRLTPGQPAG